MGHSQQVVLQAFEAFPASHGHHITGPQTSIPLEATILGTIGTVFWSVQLIPQIYHSYRTKSTEGVPAIMMFLWATCGVPFGAYAIIQNFNIPLQVQPQIFCVFSMISWAQCMVYSSKWKTWKACLTAAIVLAVYGGVQTALVLVIRGPNDRGVVWPILVLGIVAFVLLISGFLPIPLELLSRRGRVVGLNFTFLAIDCLGALFSLFALLAQTTFDEVFGIMYSLCVLIELSVFVSHGIWLLRTKELRSKAKAEGLEYDEFPEAIEWQESTFSIFRKKKEKEVTDDDSSNDEEAI